MKISLVLLAAGMGSRYGGLKQLDRIGPAGETIMDYSVYDAIQSGFDRIIFIIRKDIKEEFKKTIGSKWEGKTEVRYAFQDPDDLPGNFTVPEGRVKPWGTGQALYAARHIIDGPFAVINADDFYGRESFEALAEFLKSEPAGSGHALPEGCMCGFSLEKTLSETGTVSRGICRLSGGGHLEKVLEHLKIYPENGKIISEAADGAKTPLPADTVVSMNCWGFRKELMPELERLFTGFLREHGNELKSEFYIPLVADTLINEQKMKIKVLKSDGCWFGITYREDKDLVIGKLGKLIEAGEYPAELWSAFPC